MRMCVIVLLDNCRVPFLIANVRVFISLAFGASYEPRGLYWSRVQSVKQFSCAQFRLKKISLDLYGRKS